MSEKYWSADRFRKVALNSIYKQNQTALSKQENTLTTGRNHTNDLIIQLTPKFEKIISDNLGNQEVILVKLSGAMEEALVCTDRRVMLIKTGIWTGNAFGSNIFQLSYDNISSVEVKVGLISGYFEMSAGGMQNTQKSYWSGKKGESPQTSPNCVSLNRFVVNKFKEACNFIISHKSKSTQTSNYNGTEVNYVKIMEDLALLLERGLITQDEYSKKKADILDKM